MLFPDEYSFHGPANLGMNVISDRRKKIRPIEIATTPMTRKIFLPLKNRTRMSPIATKIKGRAKVTNGKDLKPSSNTVWKFSLVMVEAALSLETDRSKLGPFWRASQPPRTLP
jgi:hypothetical protein